MHLNIFLVGLLFYQVQFTLLIGAQSEEDETTTEDNAGACYDDNDENLISEPEDEIDVDFGPDYPVTVSTESNPLTEVTYLGEQTIIENRMPPDYEVNYDSTIDNSDGDLNSKPVPEVVPTETDKKPTELDLVTFADVKVGPITTTVETKNSISTTTEKPKRKQIPCKNVQNLNTPEPPLLEKYKNLQGADQSLTNILLLLAVLGFLALLGILLYLCWMCIKRKRKSNLTQHYDDFYDSNASKVLIENNNDSSNAAKNSNNSGRPQDHNIPLIGLDNSNRPDVQIQNNSPITKTPEENTSISTSSSSTDISLESGNYAMIVRNTSNCSLTQKFICEKSISRTNSRANASSLSRHSSYGNISCNCHKVPGCRLNDANYIDEALISGVLEGCTCKKFIQPQQSVTLSVKKSNNRTSIRNMEKINVQTYLGSK